jgi:hypothetical protein
MQIGVKMDYLQIIISVTGLITSYFALSKILNDDGKTKRENLAKDIELLKYIESQPHKERITLSIEKSINNLYS